VEESELGSNLNLALGVTRATSVTLQQTSVVNLNAQRDDTYVFFESFRVDELTPAADTYPGFVPVQARQGSWQCKNVVTGGEARDTDTISRRYMLTWQLSLA